MQYQILPISTMGIIWMIVRIIINETLKVKGYFNREVIGRPHQRRVFFAGLFHHSRMHMYVLKYEN